MFDNFPQYLIYIHSVYDVSWYIGVLKFVCNSNLSIFSLVIFFSYAPSLFHVGAGTCGSPFAVFGEPSHWGMSSNIISPFSNGDLGLPTCAFLWILPPSLSMNWPCTWTSSRIYHSRHSASSCNRWYACLPQQTGSDWKGGIVSHLNESTTGPCPPEYLGTELFLCIFCGWLYYTYFIAENTKALSGYTACWGIGGNPLS